MSINIKKVVIALILLCISGVIFCMIASTDAESIIQSSNPDSITEKPRPNVKNQNSVSCNCVAFRLDDVMDNSSTIPLLSIIDVFRERNLDLTIGVVGNEFGSDQKLVSYIKQGIMKNNETDNNSSVKNKTDGQIEIANHSWKHENFSELTIAEMSSSIKKTNEKVYDIFGVQPSVFIAPYNQFNNNVFLAMRDNNIHYFSASERNDPPPYTVSPNTTIYHLPQTAYTGDCNICGDEVKNASWFAIQHERTLKQIDRSIEKYGFAVVTLHAWEYSIGHERWDFQNKVDTRQIDDLRLLLDGIKQKGLQIVALSKVVNQFKKS